MDTFHDLVARREARAALAVWLLLPTIFLFFNLTLAVNPAAHIDRLSLGAVVLDAGAKTPSGGAAAAPTLVAALAERLGARVVPYADEASLRAAVLDRAVIGGIVVPAGTSAALASGGSVELRIVRSDANDPFSNGFTANLAVSLGPVLNAALPSLLAGSPIPPTVTVVADGVAPAPDFRFATLPGTLLLPAWIAAVAFAVLVARAGNAVRSAGDGARSVARTAAAEATLVVVAAGVIALVITADAALFAWTTDFDVPGMFALSWLAFAAIGWLLLGTVRTFGVALGAGLGIVALFVQQPVSGAAYPSTFAPDAVAWLEPIAPLRYLVEGMRDALIGGSTLGGMAVALAWIALAGLALVAVGAGRSEWAGRRVPAVGAPASAA
jgi:hypothetical protein